MSSSNRNRNKRNDNRRDGGRRGNGRRGGRGRRGGGSNRSQGGRQQGQAAVDELNTMFRDTVALSPDEWIRLEESGTDPTLRTVDLLAPIGKGQRALIVAPPKVGKTTLLKKICNALTDDRKLKVYVLLVDERPEEETDFRRSVKAEVWASSSDKDYQNHLRTAETLMVKAVREATSGEDVVVLVDSLTRLSRVHNAQSAGVGRTLSGGLDARAMEVPRRFFGAARNIENSGSLTILATILVDTGSRMDEVIFEEFKGTGNMELVMFRRGAEMRMYPAIDVNATGTRKEELLFPEGDLEKVWKLRRRLSGSSSPVDALKTFLEMLRRHPTNKKLLDSLVV